MNHETTIKRIQELVPDVMKLEFGCEVMYEWENEEKSEMVVVGRMGENFILTDYHDSFCTEANEEEFEILGKPITLATILLAIWLNKLEWLNNNDTTVLIELVKVWNLSEDNFNDQSEETKTFIGELLK